MHCQKRSLTRGTSLDSVLRLLEFVPEWAAIVTVGFSYTNIAPQELESVFIPACKCSSYFFPVLKKKIP